MSAQSHAYVFLDTETTGTRDEDEIWQLAWIAEHADGTEFSRANALIDHRTSPSQWVLRNTSYAKALSETAFPLSNLAGTIHTLYHELDRAGYTPNERGNVYLVGAVPSFDDLRIRRVIAPPWHYHLICVEVLLMGAHGAAVPPSLSDLAALTPRNVDPHDAMADAQYVRDLFHTLRFPTEGN